MINGHNAYRETSTMGMSQLDLVLTVYRGTIGFLNQAKTEFELKNYTEGRTACDKARKCLVHLYTTLDMEKGGEIAEYLGKIYAHIIEQLDIAVADKSPKYFEDMISHLMTIKEAWDGLKELEDQKNNIENPNSKTGNIDQPEEAINDDLSPVKHKELVISA
ncbi:MAG: flagellar export chaperone FliS [candidate division Zixibacteria bacterium]